MPKLVVGLLLLSRRRFLSPTSEIQSTVPRHGRHGARRPHAFVHLGLDIAYIPIHSNEMGATSRSPITPPAKSVVLRYAGKAAMSEDSVTLRDVTPLEFLKQADLFRGTQNLDGRLLDATAANLIAAHEKVRQIAQGHIPLPEVVELFITNHCEFACPHCRCAQYHGDQTECMSLLTLGKLLTELGARKVKTIELGGGGEPLDHPEIEKVLGLLVEGGFRVGLITNGYRLTKQPGLIDPLLECCDWIRFSLDGISDEVYRSVHGGDDLSYRMLRKVIANLVGRVRTRSESGKKPRIGIKLLVQEPNRDQVVASVDEAEKLGVHYLQFKWLEAHPRSIPFVERPAIVGALQRRIADLPPGFLTVDVLPGYGGPRMYGRCLMSILHPLVDWDGTVYLCAFFHHRKASHSIGNITQAGFFKHWGSSRHRNRIAQVDSKQCVTNCPLLRYNPVVEFILREEFRFPYI